MITVYMGTFLQADKFAFVRCVIHTFIVQYVKARCMISAGLFLYGHH